MLLQWPPPFFLNPVLGYLHGKDEEPEGNVRCLRFPGNYAVEIPSEETLGQHEMSVPSFSRAITALLGVFHRRVGRALRQRVHGSTQPLCPGVSPNNKVTGYPG